MKYSATGRVELIGNHTDHQGGFVLSCPAKEKIWADVSDNGQSVIRIDSEGFGVMELDISSYDFDYQRETTLSIVAGLLTGFAERFGKKDLKGRGFDAKIRSEIGVGSGLSSSSAFGMLIAYIINDRYYDGIADGVEMALIGQFAEREFYGKPGGMQDQLTINMGRLMLMNFKDEMPEYEFIDFDLDGSGYEMKIIATDSDHSKCTGEYASIPDDMQAVARQMGKERLGDISNEEFEAALPELEKRVGDGMISRLQLNRARHYFDENKRVIQGAEALKAGDFEGFLRVVDESGLSSENLLENVLPPGVEENGLSLTLGEYRKKPDVAAVKLQGGGFGGSILVFKKRKEYN